MIKSFWQYDILKHGESDIHICSKHVVINSQEFCFSEANEKYLKYSVFNNFLNLQSNAKFQHDMLIFSKSLTPIGIIPLKKTRIFLKE